jgi:hypothetical protein
MDRDLAAAIKAKADELRNAKESTDLNNVHPFFRDALAEQRASEGKSASLSMDGVTSSRKGCLEAIVEEMRSATPASGAFSLEQLREQMVEPQISPERMEAVFRSVMKEEQPYDPAKAAAHHAQLSAAMSIDDMPMPAEKADRLADQLAGGRPQQQRAEYQPTAEELRKMEYLAELSRKCAAQRRPPHLALLDSMIEHFENALK